MAAHVESRVGAQSPTSSTRSASPSIKKRMSLFTRRRGSEKRRGSEGDTAMPPVPPLPALQRQWTLPEQERKALVSPVEATPSASSTPSSPTKIAGPSSSSSSSTKPSRPAPRQVASCPQAPTQAFPSREQEDQQRFATHPYLAQLAADSLRGHGRVRSHFSIPDVMVTAAEEDGEETYFEVRLEEDKRRTQLFNHSEPVTIDMRDMVNVPVSPPMDSAATLEPLDEGAMTPTAPKRTRKSSLPLIFGRSSTPKPSKQQQQQQQRDAVASEEDEPRRSRSPYQQPAFSSSGSLPSAAASSRDSLPSSSSTPRTPPSDFPVSPPDTPSSVNDGFAAVCVPPMPPSILAAIAPVPSLSKKERKLREKEEEALMRELAKVDKMVRSHDAKLRKQQQQQQQQQQGRGRSASESESQASAATMSGSNKARNAFKRMTRFSVSTKGSAGGVAASYQAAAGGVVRKTSVVRREAPPASTAASTKKGKEPHSPPQLSSAAAAMVAANGGPLRPVRPPPLFSSQSEAAEIRRSLDQQQMRQNQQQQQQGRPSVERTKDSDESERPTFTVQEWQNLGETKFDGAVGVEAAMDGGVFARGPVGAIGEATPDVSWEEAQPQPRERATQFDGLLEQAGLAELQQRQGAGVTRRNSRGGSRTNSQRRSSRTGSVLVDGRRRSALLMMGGQEQRSASEDDGPWEEEDTLTAEAQRRGSGEETPRARTPAVGHPMSSQSTRQPPSAANGPSPSGAFPSLPLLDLGKRMSRGDFAGFAGAFDDLGSSAGGPAAGLGMVMPTSAAPAAVSRPRRPAPTPCSAAAAGGRPIGPSPSGSMDSISSSSISSSSSSSGSTSASSSSSSTPHSSASAHSTSSGSMRARREARSSTPPTSSGGPVAGTGKTTVFKSKAAARAAKAAAAAAAGATVPLPPAGTGMRRVARPAPPPI